MSRTRTSIYTSRGELVVTPTNITTGGDALGYTESGIEIEFGDQYIEEPSEETGAAPVTVFWAGNITRMRTVLKEWKDETLKLAFPDQWDNTNKRIELPSGRTEGDEVLSDGKVLLFRPDNPLSTPSTGKDPYILAFKAVMVGRPQLLEVRTTRIRKLALEFLLFPDDSILSNDANGRYPYRTLGIGAANKLSVT